VVGIIEHDVVGDDHVIGGCCSGIACSHHDPAIGAVEDEIISDADVSSRMPELDTILSDVVDDVVEDVTARNSMVDTLATALGVGGADVIDQVADGVVVGGSIAGMIDASTT